MAKDLFSRYIWLIDTIKRHGHITRDEINRCWLKSSLTDGKPIPRRSFYNYRDAIEQLFNVRIECTPTTYEYYIVEEDSHRQSTADWLLNSAATNELITTSHDIADRVFLEEVPSAREHLAVIIQALREQTPVRFNYHPYTRSRASRGVEIEPYFVKIFKQRWYVIGRNIREDRIKTYALDRISDIEQQQDTFKMPADFSPAEYFNDAFGIVVDQSEPRTISIRTDSTEAKYLRALPLHHSQSEMLGDGYSIFNYRMRITPDLVTELLSYGERIAVLAPVELKAMMRTRLQEALKHYQERE